MKQEEKELLLKDLCARLPYGVTLANGAKVRSIDILTKIVSGIGTDKKIEDTKYYLRPMSSMTEEEKKEYEGTYDVDLYNYHQLAKPQDRKIIPMYNYIDWLNSHHFDYRGLIEKGLALEAPKGMYDIKD